MPGSFRLDPPIPIKLKCVMHTHLVSLRVMQISLLWASLGFAIIGCKASVARQQINVPADDQVAAIELNISDEARIPEDLPPSSFPLVLQALRTSVHDPNPADWAIGGDLLIRTIDNKSMEIRFYIDENRKVVFSNRRFFYRSDMSFNAFRRLVGLSEISNLD
jgi:hypothetical protein